MPEIIRKPKITLYTKTELPLETVYGIWEQSKSLAPLRSPEQILDEVDPEEVRKVFRAVVAQRIPVGEHIDFTFVLEDVCIAFREQMIRHRIGTKPSPEKVGADIVMEAVPDVADSSFWAQSMVIQDMGTYADRSSYTVPDSMLNHPDSAGLIETLDLAHQTIQDAYNSFTEKGIPREDARTLIPLGALHRISWKLNMSALLHVMAKRSCWVLQLSFWGDVIRGMVNELATKVDPIFRELVTPPCIRVNRDGTDQFTGCTLMEEARRRITGEDEMPPCPLHLTKHEGRTEEDISADLTMNMRGEFMRKLPLYQEFWGRDPFTGNRLDEEQ
jgi:hypothetical protein